MPLVLEHLDKGLSVILEWNEEYGVYRLGQTRLSINKLCFDTENCSLQVRWRSTLVIQG